MSTKKTTTTTNQYNKNAYGNYNAFQPSLMNGLMQMTQNPLSSSYFQNQLAQGTAASNQMSRMSNTNALRNLRTGGGILSNSGGFTAAMLNRNMLANNFMKGNAFNSALNTALQNRNYGLSAMQAYQPLQTGQTTTEKTGGLGTWLGPIAGMAMNMVAPGLGSLMSGGGFMAGMRSAYGGGSSGGSSGGGGYMSNPFGTGGGMQTSPLPYQ